MLKEFILTARGRLQDSIDYLTLQEHDLKASIEHTRGNGRLISPDQYCVRIENANNKDWSGIIHIEMPFTKSNPRYFLPAFMYGRNRGECPQNVPNEFPRLREEMKRPSSPWWMVRSDRLSHPVAMVYDTGMLYGLCASPYFILEQGRKKQWKPDQNGEFYQYAGFTCSLERGTIGYTLGYENAPWMFIQSHKVKEREALSENCFELKPGEVLEFNMEVFDFEAESELDINSVIQKVYYQYYQKPRKGSDIRTAVEDLSMALYQDAWLPEEQNYSGQIFEKSDGTYHYNKILSISWTNGLPAAVPVLMAALRLDNEPMRKQAISCIENIIENSLNTVSGLPYEAYEKGSWSNKGWWFDGMHTPGHSSYLIGQAMYYILRAYEYEKKLGDRLHTDWLEYVKAVLIKIEKTKNTDGEYPFVLSEKTGAGIEYDSLGGAWCMAAMAYYMSLTGDRSYLSDLLKSERHYYESFISRMECYGGPLDTDKATDSEGIIAYLKAVKHLHALTTENYLLEHMRSAFYYEFSFKFCYNSPIKTPPLSRIGWSSCGGSVTSIANPHIHPMSSNLVDELLYYVSQTGDKYVRDRMYDVIGWGCQTYNTYDKEYDYGKKGWMSERFCHSEGLLTQRYEDGSLASTWFCLMPWASGSILDGLAGEYWMLGHESVRNG